MGEGAMKSFWVMGIAVVFAAALAMAEEVQLDGPGKAILGVEIKPEFQQVKGWKGLEITHVVSGSCAESIGLKQGDLLVNICGQSVRSFEDLVSGMVSIRPDKKNSIGVIREGNEKNFVFDSKDTSFKDDNWLFLVIGKHNKYASKTDILGAVVNGKETRNIHISNVLALLFCEKKIGSSKTTIIIGFIQLVDGRSVNFVI